MPVAYISFGSNLGERELHLGRALQALERETLSLHAVSPLYETAPMGGPPQGLFLNGCASFHTTLPPVVLLRRMQAIEAALGRERHERWGPRTIDLDLLLYGSVIMRTPVLELPHPRMIGRHFVLQPLADIAPDHQIPGERKTVLHLLEKRPPNGGVILYRKNWYRIGEPPLHSP